ncbi:oligopeptide ABC transporter ATP-binding protein Opp1F, partial [Enterococcus faecalis]
KDISKIKSKADMQAFRSDVQMIFQDPYASLNPRMKVNDIFAEGIDVNGLAKTPKEREEKVYELLKTVGLNPSHSTRYPHEFSGG